MSFAPSGTTFSGELTGYLNDLADERRIGEKPRVQILSAAEIDEERFLTAYHTYFGKRLQRCKRDIAKYNVNAVRLLLIGITRLYISALE